MKKSLMLMSMTSLMLVNQAYAAIDALDTVNTRSFSLQQGYFTLEDDFNIWTNPALVSKYKNRGYVELGDYTNGESSAANNGSTSEMIGVLYGMGGSSTVGLFLGRPYNGNILNVVDDPTVGPFPGFTNPINNRFDLFWATGNIGFRINYNSYVFDSKVSGSAAKSEIAARDLNLSFGMTGGLDVALTVGLPLFSAKLTSTTSVEDLKSNGAFNVAFSLRSTDNNAHKYFNYGLLAIYDKNGAKAKNVTGIVTTNASVKKDTISVSAIGGYNIRPNPENLVIASARIIVAQDKDSDSPSAGLKTSDKTTRLEIPAAISYENSDFENFVLRGSASKSLLSYASNKSVVGSTKATTNESDTISDAVTVGLGVGYKLKETLRFDFAVNQDLFFTGADFLSGIPNTLASKVSMIYTFDK